MLRVQAKGTDSLLKQELGVDIGLSVDWSNGQPRVVAHNESVIISESGTKADIQGVLYAIRSILYEAGLHQRLKSYYQDQADQEACHISKSAHTKPLGMPYKDYIQTEAERKELKKAFDWVASKPLYVEVNKQA